MTGNMFPCMVHADRDASLHPGACAPELLVMHEHWTLDALSYDADGQGGASLPSGSPPQMETCCFVWAIRHFLCGGEVRRGPPLDIPGKTK